MSSTIAPGDEPCERTATHLLIGSIREDEGIREPFSDPVCKPCGESCTRRPALKAHIVPLHVYTPTPPFLIVNGHRLVTDHKHGEACFDCGHTGSTQSFREGLYGCPGRPESVNSRELPQTDISPDNTAGELASLWRNHMTYVMGTDIGDWHPVQDSSPIVATFTFRDREYALKHSPNVVYVSAEKLPNRGRPEPVLINAEDRDTYKQVVFHFHKMVNQYESTYFATWTPGRQDVILHAPERQIRAVLRLTDLKRHADPLDEVTDAVCDAFGAVFDITFQQRIYE